MRTYLSRVAGSALLCLLLFMLADWWWPLPEPERVRSVLILAQDRTPLRAFADSEGVWRYPVTLAEVSPLYVEALLTYEDRWFYQHPGINPFALVRAGWQWLEGGRVISGGSTLTMQVARIFTPTPTPAAPGAGGAAPLFDFSSLGGLQFYRDNYNTTRVPGTPAAGASQVPTGTASTPAAQQPAQQPAQRPAPYMPGIRDLNTRKPVPQFLRDLARGPGPDWGSYNTQESEG